jgi:hypothetical protein
VSAATRSFSFMSGLDDAERATVAYAEPGTMLVDGDDYLDATSPRRGSVRALEGERVPEGGVYICRSAVGDALFERLTQAASGKI